VPAQVPRPAEISKFSSRARPVKKLQVLEKLHESFGKTNVTDITAAGTIRRQICMEP
jgi:hypothetical protein